MDLAATQALLQLFLLEWHELLQQWASDGRLSAAAREALLLDGEPKALKDFVTQWSTRDLSNLPAVFLLPSASMPGAAGAYAGKTKSFYVNQDWLITASNNQVISTLTEELGYFLDDLLNPADTQGNEGQLFSRLLVGDDSINSSEPQGQSSKSHTGAIILSGESVAAELSTIFPVIKVNKPTQISDGILSITNAESGRLVFTGIVSESNDIGSAGFGLKFFAFTFTGPNGHTRDFYISSDDLDADGSFSKTLEFIGATSGSWSLSRASIADNAGNYATFDLRNSDSAVNFKAATGLDPAALAFTVSNPNPDSAAPRITLNKPSQLLDGRLDITSGESGKLVFTGSIIDYNDAGKPGFGLQSFWLTFTGSSGHKLNFLISNDDLAANGSFSKTLEFSGATPGSWSLSSASIADNAGNSAAFDLSNPDSAVNFKAATGLDPAALAFTVSNPNPDSAVPRITLNKPSQLLDGRLDITNGESGKLVFTGSILDYNDAAKPGFGLHSFWFILTGSNGHNRILYLNNNDLAADGSFSKNFEFSGATSGSWILSSASIADNAGNSATFDLRNSDSAVDFKAVTGLDPAALAFTVSNPNPDSVVPRITLNKPSQLLDGKLDITNGESGKLVFSGSILDYNDAGKPGFGLKSFWFTLTGPNGHNRDLYLNNNDLAADGSFFQTLDLSGATSGSWILSSASIADNAGNTGIFDGSNSDSAVNFKAATGLDPAALAFTVSNPDPDSVVPRITLNKPSQLLDGKLDITNSESGKLAFTGSILDYNDAGKSGFGLQSFNFTLTGPDGHNRNFNISNNHLATDGSFSETLDFSWTRSGYWSVSEASISDNAGNLAYFNLRNSDSAANFKAATGLNPTDLAFNVANLNPDSTPPIITFNRPTQLSDGLINIANGESAKLVFTGKLIDLNDEGKSGSGLSYFFFTFIGPDGIGRNLFILNSNVAEDGSFSTVLDLSWTRSGSWSLSRASIGDNAGNIAFFDALNPDSAANFKAATGLDPAALAFTVSNPNPDLAPPIIIFNKPAQLSDGLLDIDNGESGKLVFTGKIKDLDNQGNFGSGLSYCSLTFTGSNGTHRYLDISNSDLTADGSFFKVLDLSWIQSGTWSLSRASIGDNAGNTVSYDLLNPDSAVSFKAATGLDPEVLRFTVASNNKDTLPPSFSLQVPSQLSDAKLDLVTQESGGLVFRGKITDLNDSGRIGSGLQSFWLSFSGPNDSIRNLYISNSELDADGSFSKTLDFNGAKAGSWFLSYASISDNVGNSAHFNASNPDSAANFKSAAGLDFADLAFTVANNNPDSTTPRITLNVPSQLSDGKLDIINGESAKLSLAGRISDLNETGKIGSGLQMFSIVLAGPNGLFRSFDISNSELTADGSFFKTLNFSGAKSGDWSLYTAYISDKTDNSASFNVHNPDSAANFKVATGLDPAALAFTVSNANPDATVPIITLNKPSQLSDGRLDIANGEIGKLMLTGKISDLNDAGKTGFGLNVFSLMLTGPNGLTRDFYISSHDLAADGSFSKTLDMSGGLSGYWSVSSASISDNTGNVVKYDALDPDTAAKFQALTGIDPAALAFDLRGGSQSFTEPKLSIQPSLKARIGSSISVPIIIDKASSLQSIDLLFAYDSTIFSVPLQENIVKPGASTNGWRFVANASTPGQIRISGFGDTSLISGSAEILSLNLNINADLNVGIAGLDLVSASFNEASINADLGDGILELLPPTFQVIGIRQIASGLAIKLSEAPNSEKLNLYDGNDASIDNPDLRITRSDGKIVDNLSLHWDANAGELYVLRTDTLTGLSTAPVRSDLLAPGTYTLNIDARRDGLVSASRDELLDGNRDGITGDTFTYSFTQNTPLNLVSIGDTARGAGQSLSLNGASTANGIDGLPVLISTTASLSKLSGTVAFDSSALQNISLIKGKDLPLDWTLETQVNSPGSLIYNASGTTAITGTNRELFRFGATVSPSAVYKSSTLIKATFEEPTSPNLTFESDPSLVVLAYSGDTTGNGAHSSLDASRVQRVVVGLDSGFDAYDDFAPILIGDTTGNGGLSSLDASRIQREVVGLPVDSFPSIPVMPQPS